MPPPKLRQTNFLFSSSAWTACSGTDTAQKAEEVTTLQQGKRAMTLAGCSSGAGTLQPAEVKGKGQKILHLALMDYYRHLQWGWIVHSLEILEHHGPPLQHQGMHVCPLRTAMSA
jgi:hypothetical protein